MALFVYGSMKLLKFYADWCGPCRMMKPMVDQIAKEHDLELQEVNIDNDIELAHQYGVQGVPTLILLDENANEIGRNVGLLPKAIITAALGL